MTTITWPSGTTDAIVEITSQTSTQRARTVVHAILDGPEVVTVRPAESRRLTLRIYVDDETLADDLRTAFADGHTVTLTDAARPTLPAAVILVGTLEVELKPTGWIVTAAVMEVEP